MLGVGILNSVELFKTALGLFGFPLDENDGTREFVGHFISAMLEFLLLAGQFLQSDFFLLYLILPFTKLQEFRLGSLDLILKLFG